MSTFKRLLNLGKGKVKAATRRAETPAPRAPTPSGEELLADARRAVADAAEALADAIRPEDAEAGEPVAAPEAEDPLRAAEAREPGAKSDLAGGGSEEPAEEAPAPPTPAKRTL